MGCLLEVDRADLSAEIFPGQAILPNNEVPDEVKKQEQTLAETREELNKTKLEQRSLKERLEKMTILAQEAQVGLTKAEIIHQKETAELRKELDVYLKARSMNEVAKEIRGGLEYNPNAPNNIIDPIIVRKQRPAENDSLT